MKLNAKAIGLMLDYLTELGELVSDNALSVSEAHSRFCAYASALHDIGVISDADYRVRTRSAYRTLSGIEVYHD